MTNDKVLLELMKYVLPREIVDYFDLVSIQASGETSDIYGELDIYLEETNIIPEEYKAKGLCSNGFYEESTIKDFPLRDRKVVLHVRRRRWVDNKGKSYSRQWELTSEGTRYSKEFAFFLKETFGYIPNTSPFS
jgi:hypothetical protein